MEKNPLPPALLWQKCLAHLQNEITPEEFNLWIRPLQLEFDNDQLCLFAPNRYVLEHINEKFLAIICQCLTEFYPENLPHLQLKV